MKPIQVSQLTRYIKTILQHDPLLSNISVKGEISNLTYHGTGHVYFSLKDSGSRVSCFLAADKARYIRYPLEEGMEIIASGYINIYEKGGSYSLNVRDVVIEGEGNLAAAFEKLKKKLEGEGLFDMKHKKSLPIFPKSVGVVTSATGAAVRDIIRTIKSKNNYVNIIVCPCLVQGDGAAGDIEDAIKALNRMDNPPDVIIAGRGGGSTEELWAFNEERVARSIFASEIPIISAVGHETDFTIADFVADYRAATPTGAAEAAVPDIRELKEELRIMHEDMKLDMNRKIQFMENSVERYSKEYMASGLEKRIELLNSRIDSCLRDIQMAMKEKLHQEELRIERLRSRMESMNPGRIMELGYGAVSDADGKYIKSMKSISEGDEVRVDLSDGSMQCVVKQVKLK